MSITETVLEMHYHRPLMELFQKTYGLGFNGKFNFFKYSPQREVFVGFDQAFAMTKLTDNEFFEQLKSSSMNTKYKLSSRFIDYFLQFKFVTELQKHQKKTPTQIKSRLHYRAALLLKLKEHGRAPKKLSSGGKQTNSGLSAFADSLTVVRLDE